MRAVSVSERGVPRFTLNSIQGFFSLCIGWLWKRCSSLLKSKRIMSTASRFSFSSGKVSTCRVWAAAISDVLPNRQQIDSFFRFIENAVFILYSLKFCVTKIIRHFLTGVKPML